MTSGLLVVGKDDFRVVCHCVSVRLLVHSSPQAAVTHTQTHKHTQTLYCHK